MPIYDHPTWLPDAGWPTSSDGIVDFCSWSYIHDVQSPEPQYELEMPHSTEPRSISQSTIKSTSLPWDVDFNFDTVSAEFPSFSPSSGPLELHDWTLPTPWGSDIGSITDIESPKMSLSGLTRSSSPSETAVGISTLASPETNTHSCGHCGKVFARVSEIEEHGKRERHKPFSCTPCNKSFSRRDAWMRHQEVHKSQGQFPCLSCTKYQGADAFRRRDHLRQHLRKFHRVHPNTEFPRFCRYSSCTFGSAYENFSGFKLRKDYTRHMREFHGEETHDCYVPGCKRMGSRGFLRLNDLERHVKLTHANTTCVPRMSLN